MRKHSNYFEDPLSESCSVDDASEREYLGSELEQELAGLPVRILRSPARVGLIQARLMGARAAKETATINQLGARKMFRDS